MFWDSIVFPDSQVSHHSFTSDKRFIQYMCHVRTHFLLDIFHLDVFRLEWLNLAQMSLILAAGHLTVLSFILLQRYAPLIFLV